MFLSLKKLEDDSMVMRREKLKNQENKGIIDRTNSWVEMRKTKSRALW